MNATMDCPDDLLVMARRGTLSALQRERLDAHVAWCADCAAALTTGDAFDRATLAHPGDDALAARIAAAVVVRAADVRLFDARRARARSNRTRWWMAAAAVAIALSASAATWLSLRASSHTVVPRPRPTLIAAPPVATDPPQAAREPALVATPPVATALPVVAAQETAGPVHAMPATRAAPSASALFTQANRARRSEDAAAVGLYRELERRYPSSPEAEQSYVSLGTLLTQRGDVAAAQAQFDAYLAAHGSGPLAAEAMFGRATALARLGRSPDERTTWQRLIERFPDSVYAARARRRLAEMH